LDAFIFISEYIYGFHQIETELQLLLSFFFKDFDIIPFRVKQVSYWKAA